MSKLKLLFVTPVPPCKTGPGISIRSYNILKALSTKYEIYLLTIMVFGFGKPALDPEVLEMCRDVAILTIRPLEYFLMTKIASFIRRSGKPPELIFLTKKRLRKVDRSFSGVHFDVIHVFRLYMVPYIRNMLKRGSVGHLQLDLDDIESITRMRLSKLYELNGDSAMSNRIKLEAKQYEDLERESLTLFDQIYVCSESDKHKIHNKYNCNRVKVLPNTVEIPKLSSLKRKTTIFNFLFVGSFGYYPNIDAAIYFCDQILPLLRKYAPSAFSFKIAGRNIPRIFASHISAIPEVDLIGPVVDIGPIYELSDAVVIPIRAGGGTRIKVLEAFAYRKPVISTSLGVDGIEVNHEQHVLIGDSAEDFAQQCVRVMLDSNTRNKIIDNSFSLVQSNYNFEVVREMLCGNSFSSLCAVATEVPRQG